MNKKKPGSNGIVYSTDPDFRLEEDRPSKETPAPRQQKLKVRLDTKQRAGKAVSLIQGFAGKKEDLEALGRQLRSHCGTGGSVKDGEIIVQGDQRDKITQFLLKNGYSLTKRL